MEAASTLEHASSPGKLKFSSQSLNDIMVPGVNVSEFQEEEFISILKILYSEIHTEDVKLENLFKIQQDHVLQSGNYNVIEFVVTSLHALFQNLVLVKRQNYLCSQILITATQLLLSASAHDNEKDCDFYKLACKHRDFLLQVSFVSNVQKPDSLSPLILNIGSKCLEEMEIEMPGIISEGCVDQVWSLCRQKNINMFYLQATIILLSQIIRNQDDILKKQILRSGSMEEQILDQNNLDGNIAPHDIALSLLDSLAFTAPATTYHTFNNIVEILHRHNPKIFSGVLKMWLSKLSFSSDIMWLHFSLFLQHCLENGSIVGDEDKQYLFLKLCERSNHATISPAERLLLLDWIETILELKSCNQNYLISHLKWLPGPFDGNDTFVKKMRILISSTPDKSFENAILPAVNGLRKAVLNNKAGRSSVVVLRTLYHVHKKIKENRAIENHSCMLAISLLDQSMSAMRLIIDFIESIKTCDPESGLPEALWKGILNRLVSLNPEEAYINLKWLLLCLHHVGQSDFPIGRIKSFLRYLGRLVDTCKELRSNWINAHSLLSELTQLLGRADAGMLYSELGTLLHALSQPSDNDVQPDVDVCSRAKLCYSSLTSLTPPKLRQLFMSHASTQPLVNVSSDVRLTAPFVQFKKPVLIIEKGESKALAVYDDSAAAYSESGIDSYFEKVKDRGTNGMIKIKLRVKCAVDNVEEKFSTLYGVTIKSYANANLALPIEDIDIPSLTANMEKEIEITISPLRASPILLKFSNVFTTSSGESFFSPIDSEVTLNVEELFLPLKCDTSIKTIMFDELWEYLNLNFPKTYSTCFVPIEDKSLLDKWKKFMVSCDKSESRAAMFLPPETHLLFKFSQSKEVFGTQLFLVTDNMNCLPWFNNYLNNL